MYTSYVVSLWVSFDDGLFKVLVFHQDGNIPFKLFHILVFFGTNRKLHIPERIPFLSGHSGISHVREVCHMVSSIVKFYVVQLFGPIRRLCHCMSNCIWLHFCIRASLLCTVGGLEFTMLMSCFQKLCANSSRTNMFSMCGP